MKENSASVAFVSSRGEFLDDRWIPCTKGQWRGKCFQLMTLTWEQVKGAWLANACQSCRHPALDWLIQKWACSVMVRRQHPPIFSRQTCHYHDWKWFQILLQIVFIRVFRYAIETTRQLFIQKGPSVRVLLFGWRLNSKELFHFWSYKSGDLFVGKVHCHGR